MPLVCDRGISMINIAICDDEKKDIVHLKSILQEVMDKYSMSMIFRNMNQARA